MYFFNYFKAVLDQDGGNKKQNNSNDSYENISTHAN